MIENRAKRKLSGILSADAMGYSRLMQEDEASTIRKLEVSKELMTKHIQHYRGRVVDAPGDNLLAEFGSVVDATECAVKIQTDLKAKNTNLPDNRRMQFRIGINLGDVVEEKDCIYGDGVNIAARIEELALDSNDPIGYYAMASALIWAGNPVDGAEFIKKAMRRGTLKMLKTGIYLQGIRCAMPPSSAVTDRLPCQKGRLPEEILIILKLLMKNFIFLRVSGLC